MQEDENQNPEGGDNPTGEEEQQAPTSKDPLDAMEDSALRGFALGKGWKVEEALEGDDLRAEIKKQRSISQRHESKPQPTVEKDVVRLSDLENQQEQEAKESLEDADDATLVDIRENWSEIAAYYSPRNGRKTAKAILKDMRAARAAYREDNPLKDTEDTTAAADISKVTGKGGHSPKPTAPKKGGLMPKRNGIDSWFPKEDA